MSCAAAPLRLRLQSLQLIRMFRLQSLTLLLLAILLGLKDLRHHSLVCLSHVPGLLCVLPLHKHRALRRLQLVS